MRPRLSLDLAGILAIAATGVACRCMAAYTFTDFTYPGANDTVINNLNNSGGVVGFFTDALNVTQPLEPGWQGFYYDGQEFIPLAPPGAVASEATTVTDDGVVAGHYIDASDVIHGFIYRDGAYTIVNADLPDSIDTTIIDRDENGVLVGYFAQELIAGLLDVTHGYRATPTTGGGYSFEQVDLGDPAALLSNTLLNGRNNAGQEIATVRDSALGEDLTLIEDRHGVLLPNIEIRYPGAIATQVTGINDDGVISGLAVFSAETGVNTFEITETPFTVLASDLASLLPSQVPYRVVAIPGVGCTYSTTGELGSVDLNCHHALNAVAESGVIAGFYDMDDGVYRGFIGVPQSVDGDLDSDGDVDGHDFLIWQRTGATDQIAAWEANFGSSFAATEQAPEPRSLSLALMLASSTPLGRRRHRCDH